MHPYRVASVRDEIPEPNAWTFHPVWLPIVLVVMETVAIVIFWKIFG